MATKRQRNGINDMIETIEAGKYTRQELYWEVCRYRQQFEAKEISLRTFRHWRQKLELVPDQEGKYWEEDLQKIKLLIRGISQGQNLEQIATMLNKE